MARLTKEARDKLPDSAFAEPGKRAYPMQDAQHRAAAAGFAAMHHDKAAQKAVHAKLKRHAGYGGKVFDSDGDHDND